MNSPNERGRLALDKENARWLGVCAGIARWLDLPTAVVRVIFVICVISWPTILLAYVIIYFVLDRGITADSAQDYFRGADTAEHFRQLNYRKPLYRFPSRGRIAGVCAGIADYLEIRPFWVRLATLGSLFVFGPFTLLAYVVCWIAFDIAPSEPAYCSRRGARRQQRKARREARRDARRRGRDERSAEYSATRPTDLDADDLGNGAPQQEFDQGPSYSRAECDETFRRLEIRLREIEAYMTSKRFRLHCEINRI